MLRLLSKYQVILLATLLVAVTAPAARADYLDQTVRSAASGQCGSPAFADWNTRTGAIRTAATYPQFHAGHDPSYLRQDPKHFTRIENGSVTATSMKTICSEQAIYLATNDG